MSGILSVVKQVLSMAFILLKSLYIYIFIYGYSVLTFKYECLLNNLYASLHI